MIVLCPTIFTIVILFVSETSGSSKEESTDRRFGDVESGRKMGNDSAWQSYKLLMGKSYLSTTSERRRYKFWKDSCKKVNSHNKQFHQGHEFYLQKLYSFSDLPPSKLIEKRTAVSPFFVNEEEMDTTTIAEQTTPNFFDWRLLPNWPHDSRYHCGLPLGWLLAAIETVESHLFIKEGRAIPLATQELMDCMAPSEYQPGSLLDAFSYIKREGISSMATYPFNSLLKKDCQSENRDPMYFNFQTIIRLTPDDEDNLKRAVALIGPVAVNIYVTRNFFHYFSGIFYDRTCHNAHPTNHAVMVVGYGTDQTGQDFWIMQNSWGSIWGENGYFRMARNTLYNCGITSAAFCPILQ